MNDSGAESFFGPEYEPCHIFLQSVSGTEAVNSIRHTDSGHLPVEFCDVQTCPDLSRDEDHLNHVYHVQRASAEYLRLIVDLETGFRGFVLTTQDQFLQPYQAAKTRVLSLGQWR